MHDDGSLSDHRFVVSGSPLTLFRRALEYLALLENLDVVRSVPLRRVGAFAEVRPRDHFGMRVVHRDAPAEEGVAPEVAGSVSVDGVHRAGLGDVGQDVFLHARPDVCIHPSRDGAVHRERAFVILHVAQHSPGVGELRPVDQGVQEHRVDGVDAVLRYLQPVARKGAGVGLHHGVRNLESVVDGELRSLRGWSEVGENDALVLEGRISALTDLGEERTAGGFGRSLEERAVDVPEPAVVAAADALVFDASVLERRAPVRAMAVQQADPSRSVAEEHQVLAEESNCERQVADFLRERDAVPEAAQVLSAGRARPDVGELRILGRDVAVLVAAIGSETFDGQVHRYVLALMPRTPCVCLDE